MKKILLTGLATVALLLSFANCGKSGGGSNPNTYTAPYNPSRNNAAYYNNQYGNYYGQGQNYCQNSQQYGGCVTCSIPCGGYGGSGGGCGGSGGGYGGGSYGGGCGGYGCQQVVYANQGYYAPQYGMYGQGGQFTIGASYTGSW